MDHRLCVRCGPVRGQAAPADTAKAKTVPRELARMLAAGAIGPVTHAADLALYRDVRRPPSA